MHGIKLIYLMDPHCGWCFGYSKTITQFHERRVGDGSIDFEVVPGGLFIPRVQGSSEFADDKRPIASRIERVFDVEFSSNYFENVLEAPWIDSTPSSRAILACNVTEPSRTLPLATAIIQAAFVEGRNISMPNVVLEIAAEQGIATGHFEDVMASQRVDDDLASALHFAAEARTGFPSVFVVDAGRREVSHLGGPDLSLDELLQAVDDRL